MSVEDKRREGALACLMAVSKMTEGAHEFDDTAAGYHHKRYNDALALAASLGPMSPFLEGAIVALAEIIHFTETTGAPDFAAGWTPWAGMTEDERTAEVVAMQADHDADEARFGRGSLAPVSLQ